MIENCIKMNISVLSFKVNNIYYALLLSMKSNNDLYSTVTSKYMNYIFGFN